MKHYVILCCHVAAKSIENASVPIEYDQAEDMYENNISCIVSKDKKAFRNIPDSLIIESGVTSDDTTPEDVLSGHIDEQIYNEVGECDIYDLC